MDLIETYLSSALFVYRDSDAYAGRRNKSSDEDRMEYQYELFI